jgi:flagellar hook-associated protein 2
MNPMSNNNVSPIDVTTIVNTLMQKEQMGMNKLKRDESKQEVQLNQYSSLSTLLQTFGTNLQALTGAFNAIGFQVTSSNPNAVTAQVTGNNVAPIPHTLNVTQLAQASSQISTAFSSGSIALGITDSIGMAIGSNTLSIDVAATDSLQNVRDNINNDAQAAQLGVNASIVSTSSGAQLIISSAPTGVANAVSVTDSSGSFGFTQQTAALDAQFQFDNMNVTSASNNIPGVIDGLNINLLGVSNGNVSLTINALDPAAQQANVTSAIQTLLTSYNQIVGYIDQVQANPKTANETFPLIKLSLQNALTNTVTGSGVFHSLNDIGIVTQPSIQESTTVTYTDQNGKEVQKDIHYSSTGQLQLNTDSLLPTLSEAMQYNFASVQSLLTNAQTGLLTAVSNLTDPLMGSISQSMQNNVDNINQFIQTDKQGISDEEERLSQVRDFLTHKYAALNVLLQRMQETNDYMFRQLQTLNNEERMSANND